MSGVAPTITVVVPSICRPELRACLASLRAQTRPPDEVFVVLPPDDADCEELLGEEDGVAVERAPRAGIVAAVNSGLARATGDVVCLLDDDAEAPPGWLAGVAGWFRDPLVGAAGGPIVPAGRRLEDLPPTRRWDRFLWFGYGDLRPDRRPPAAAEAHFLPEANLAFRRELVPAVDPNLLGRDQRFGDDVTLGVRARGYRVIADPALFVWHADARGRDAPAGAVPSREQAHAIAHNQTYLWLKHLPPWRRPLFLVHSALAGDRSTKGLLAFAAWMARALREPGRAREVRRLVGPTFRGRMAGLRTYRALRGPAPSAAGRSAEGASPAGSR